MLRDIGKKYYLGQSARRLPTYNVFDYNSYTSLDYIPIQAMTRNKYLLPLSYTLLLLVGISLSWWLDSALLRSLSIVFGGLSAIPLYRWERKRKGYSRQWLLLALGGSYTLWSLLILILAFTPR